mmetsp:Transcript_4521/g.6601  ORF Transcript_4521/g.6601 Transcript_4521/m.6601 type:complete len:767 (+) Transcript_4521:108-2408(+)
MASVDNISMMSGSQRSQRRVTTMPSDLSTNSNILANNHNNTEEAASESAKRRRSTLGLRVRTSTTFQNNLIQAKIHEHCDIEYKPEECEITQQRLDWARKNVVHRRTSCALGAEEKDNLMKEQQCIKSLFITGEFDEDDDAGEEEEKSSEEVIHNLGLGEIQESNEEEEEQEEEVVQLQETQVKCIPPPPQDKKKERSKSTKIALGNIKAKLMKLKLRSRLDFSNDGVLGVQSEENSDDADQVGSLPLMKSVASHRNRQQRSSILAPPSAPPSRKRSSIILPPTHRRCSISSSNYRGSVVDENFVKYNMNMKLHMLKENDEDEEDEDREMDVECVDYVRKPDLANILEQYDAMTNHPKYSLKQVIMSRRFFLYAHRFANAQFQRTLVFPSLPQPPELYHGFDDTKQMLCGECTKVTEKQRTRPKGHRFIITADTQYGILMDGFAMNTPNWSQEIEISRKCVNQINAMQGDERPLFVCVCGDLVDTESSFSGAIASWKKVMKGWERNLVFAQQVNDFKRVWSGLHPDIALVCLCGNHDVGNRPTKASIEHWTSSFGDEYLSFWANGSFNLCLNNCLFSNPTGAPDMFDEQVRWMEEKLAYARENDATHIFVHGHFPWFLKHEEEADDELTSHSAAPAGWGPPGTKFEDGYFTIPYEYRKIAMAMFKKYDVTACFSGHFHQNVTAQSSWGMPMIVTGPLSMNLHSSIAHELSNGEVNGIGMRIVDVGEKGQFNHKWTLLDDEEEIFEHAIERCERQLMTEIITESIME